MALIKRQLRPKTMEMARRHGHKSIGPITGGFKKESRGLMGGTTEKVWNSKGIRRRVTSFRPEFFGVDIIKTEKTYDDGGKFVKKTKSKVELGKKY